MLLMFQLESSGSSGHSHSISQSQDESLGLQVPSSSGAGGGSSTPAPQAHQQPPPSSSSSTLTVPSTGRTLTRAQSAGEAGAPKLPNKRSRFLRRQDCLEKGMDLTTDGSDAELGTSPHIKSSPNSPLMGSGYQTGMGSPIPNEIPPLALKSSPSGSEDRPSILPSQPSSSTPSSSHPHPLTKQKSQPLLPSEHHGYGRHSIYSSPPYLEPPPPPMSHKLPSVRVIPDASADHLSSMDAHHHLQPMPAPNVRLLCPPDYTEGRRLQLVKSRSTDSSFERVSLHHRGGPVPSGSGAGAASISPAPPPNLPPPATSSTSYDSAPAGFGSPPPPSSTTSSSSPPSTVTTSALPSSSSSSIHQLPPQQLQPQQQHHSLPPPPPSHHHLPHSEINSGSGGGSSGASSSGTSGPIHPIPHHQPPHQQPLHQQQPSAQPTPSSSSSLLSLPAPPQLDQFGHCPKAREGPALGCNYCWNTTDTNGRILRRKTKYHCPDCQANLCIVPCFQQYHEALDREKGVSPH